MHIVTVTATLNAPVEPVWALVGNFGGLKAWSASVKDCIVEGHGVGSHRVIVTAAGSVRERLDEWDPSAYRVVYAVESGSSLPVRGMRATITLTPETGSRTRVDWRVDGEPLGRTEEVAAQLTTRYQARLEELRSVCTKPVA